MGESSKSYERKGQNIAVYVPITQCNIFIGWSQANSLKIKNKNL